MGYLRIATAVVIALAVSFSAFCEEKGEATLGGKSPAATGKPAAVTPLKKGDRIVFLGDSITQAGGRPNGYITLVKNAINEQLKDLDITVINAGISGHKVPDCQARLERDVLSKNPTVVVIYIGINDVWHSQHGKGTPKDKYEAGLNDLIARVARVRARAILCTPSVIGEKEAGTNSLDAMLDEYSDISRKVAKETSTQLLDLRKAFVEHLKQHNPKNAERGVLTTDGVHLNEAGNKFAAEQMLKALGVTKPEKPAGKEK